MPYASASLFCLFRSALPHQLARRKEVRFCHHARETAEGSAAERICDPHRTGSNKLTFSGSETIKLQIDKTGHESDPERARDGDRFRFSRRQAASEKSHLLDAGEQTLTLNLPNELPAGEHELMLAFSGKINQQGQGLFYARYQEQGTNEKKIMFGTQFEATDARRMFPCWDEPSFRARFQLTAVVPKNFMAVSNMPVEQEKDLEGTKEVQFAITSLDVELSRRSLRRGTGCHRERAGWRQAAGHRDKRKSRDGSLRARE
jgi:hypothetical protein